VALFYGNTDFKDRLTSY